MPTMSGWGGAQEENLKVLQPTKAQIYEKKLEEAKTKRMVFIGKAI